MHEEGAVDTKDLPASHDKQSEINGPEQERQELWQVSHIFCGVSFL